MKHDERDGLMNDVEDLKDKQEFTSAFMLKRAAFLK